MKFGISLLPDCRPSRRPVAEYYREVLELSVQADALGFEYVKMTEHYLGTYGGYCPSPLTFLSSVAVLTSRIRVMTGCMLPAFHHPIQIAAHAAMVDAISGGRLDCGFARAWLPYEFEAFGVSMDDSRELFESTIETVIRLWTEPEVTVDTPHFAFRGATSTPGITQRPHPPVWGAAIRSPQSFEWLARKGFGLLVSPPPLRRDLWATRQLIDIYRSTFEEVHGSLVGARVALAIPLYVAPTTQLARSVALPAIKEYLDVSGEAAAAWTDVTSSNYAGYQNMSDAFAAITPQLLAQDAAAVVGSPDEVVDQIGRLTDALPVDTILWNVDYGGQGLGTMAPSIERFATEVAPQLEARTAKPVPADGPVPVGAGVRP
ncbi:MAG: LLM class flavin-dependent oxidoreductase [Humibacillus sp.]|nr:LLM class flavin-dependent oxidoreductase [Humibacillus sp.]MDN5775880.1 LLM class flavin-dependent oxidoreductase [Humibacillus sp.]